MNYTCTCTFNMLEAHVHEHEMHNSVTGWVYDKNNFIIHCICCIMLIIFSPCDKQKKPRLSTLY